MRLLLSCTLLAVSTCSLCSSEQTTEMPKITIGLVLPLTGDAGAFGRNVERGARLAVEQRSEEDGTRWTVLAEDSQGDAKGAISAARKLLDVDGADLLVGDVTSAGTHALLPVATDAGKLVISPAASDPALTGKSQLFLRLWPSDIFEASVIGRHILAKDYKELAVVYANTDYGLAMVNELRETVPAEKFGDVIMLDRETADYRPALARFRAADVDALFMVLYPEDARRLLGQINETGWAVPILATSTVEDPSVLSAIGSLKVVFASPMPPAEDNPIRKQFTTAYRERWGEDPGVLSDIGYDIVAVVAAEQPKQGKIVGLPLVEAIKSRGSIDGVSGQMSFDKNGDVTKAYRLKTVHDGAFTWLTGGP